MFESSVSSTLKPLLCSPEHRVSWTSLRWLHLKLSMNRSQKSNKVMITPFCKGILRGRAKLDLILQTMERVIGVRF